MKKLFFITLLIFCIFGSYNKTYAQNYNETLGQKLNSITTAVPFLMIAPDSRSSAMGDAGVALSPDSYAQYWNSSKLAFVKAPIGLSVSYTPWLTNLGPDLNINLAYISGFYQIDKNQTIGASLRYFSMGNISFTDESNKPIGNYSPHEFSLDGSYNRKLSENFSLGVAGRFAYSNLTGGTSQSSGTEINAGKSMAIDINGFYTNEMEIGGYEGNWAAGFNFSNIGAKMGYTEDEKNFLPTNMRLGAAGTLDFDEYNSITLTADINKLLVPTPPKYYKKGEEKEDGTICDGTISPENIKSGKNNHVPVIKGLFQSFNDAPRGFEEEMEELYYSIGMEYWYAKQFAVRGGYFHENKTKGGRRYFAAGVGLRMTTFGLDFSYLIPAGNFNTSPFSNTWRFSLTFDFGNISK